MQVALNPDLSVPRYCIVGMSLVSGKKLRVIADLSVVPLGHASTSTISFVADAYQAMKAVKGLRCELTPMGTVLEAEHLDIIFEAVRLAHEALVARGIQRIQSSLRIDDRRDKPRSMGDKVEAVRRALGHHSVKD